MFGQRFNLSRFTRFLGDQPDQKLVVGGPQLIYRTGLLGPDHQLHAQCDQCGGKVMEERVHFLWKSNLES